MNKLDKMKKMVDGILGDDDLCEGCEFVIEGLTCAECRRKYADEIIKILRMPEVAKMVDKADTPQTDCGDFADRLAYERGVKHAWEVAQKVFDSTVTFYEAEDVAKRITKTEPQTDCNGCKFVGTYDTEFPCANCSRKTKDYYAKDEAQTDCAWREPK